MSLLTTGLVDARCHESFHSIAVNYTAASRAASIAQLAKEILESSYYMTKEGNHLHRRRNGVNLCQTENSRVVFVRQSLDQEPFAVFKFFKANVLLSHKYIGSSSKEGERGLDYLFSLCFGMKDLIPSSMPIKIEITRDSSGSKEVFEGVCQEYVDAKKNWDFPLRMELVSFENFIFSGLSSILMATSNLLEDHIKVNADNRLVFINLKDFLERSDFHFDPEKGVFPGYKCALMNMGHAHILIPASTKQYYVNTVFPSWEWAFELFSHGSLVTEFQLEDVWALKNRIDLLKSHLSSGHAHSYYTLVRAIFPEIVLMEKCSVLAYGSVQTTALSKSIHELLAEHLAKAVEEKELSGLFYEVMDEIYNREIFDKDAFFLFLSRNRGVWEKRHDFFSICIRYSPQTNMERPFSTTSSLESINEVSYPQTTAFTFEE